MNLLFNFEGRIGRGKYWLGTLIQPILLLIAALVVFGLFPFTYFTPDHSFTSTGWFAVAALAIFGYWTSACIIIKRYHDLDKPGVWYLMVFVPIIGPIWVLVECGFFAGTPGANDYGPPDSGGWGSSVDDEIEALRRGSQAVAQASTFSTSIRAARNTREAQPGLARQAPAGFGRRGLQT
ncbi:MAG: DUF805 domain-containing protein [Stappiaceae bacterium]